MTVLVRGQLGGWPDVALGEVGRMFGQFIFLGVQCIPADSYLPTPLHFPNSNSYFLLDFSTNAYL